MFKTITTPLANRWALLRSLSTQSLKRIMFLVITGSILPMVLAFGIVTFVLSTVFGMNDLSIWALIPVIIGVSISRIFYFAKRFNKQEKMAQQAAK